MKRKLECVMGILVILSVLYFSYAGVQKMATKETLGKLQFENEMRELKVVVDPGHGGDDPGKIGIDGSLEKDINLEIAMKLGALLKESGAEVYYTREKDMGLYTAGSKNKKSEDLKKRCKIVENVKPDVTISIHQNSFTESYVKGAQVFYFGQSKDSKLLAECIQKKLIEEADQKNTREAKANDSYYILKRTVSPTIIVECGFLSNPEEAKKLQKKAYQQKIVKGIYEGLLLYLSKVL